jgi:glycerol-3-phosphate dehydrogenase subunit B
VSGGYNIIVVGAGLSGLLAAWFARGRGERVVVVARGMGTLPLTAGCIDVLGYSPDGEPVANLSWWLGRAFKEKPEHPYQLAGSEALRDGVDALQALYPLYGSLKENLFLPTAAGALRPTCLAPESLAGGYDVAGDEGCLLVGFEGWRDFDAGYAAANLGIRAAPISLPDKRLVNATAVDIARRFEQADFRDEVARRVRLHLNGEARVGFPAVLGMDAAASVREDLEGALGAAVFEIPTLPPSVPGMRLDRALRGALRRAGVEVILGPTVRGWVQGDSVLGIRTYGASGERVLAADAVILATGGLLNGGLEIGGDGQLTESVLDLPVKAQQGDRYFEPLLMAHHPIFEAGVRVNAAMQPLDAMYAPIYPNVCAIGGLLANADRIGESSTQGIAIATAWRAVEALSQ